MKNRLRPLFVSLIVIGSAGIAQASSLEWKGFTTGLTGGTNETWNTNSTANWWDGSTAVNWPAAGGTDDDAVFSGTAGTVTISGGVTANDLTFSTPGYTITGGTLTLNGAVAPIITNAGAAEIASVVAGSVLINKAGTGTLTLSANNTFTGGVTSTGGVIKIKNSNGLGTGSKTITARAGSARLELDASGADINLASGIVLNTSGIALRNIAGNNTIAGRVDMGNGSGNTTIGSNGGTLTLTGVVRSSNSGNRSLDLTGTSTTANTVAGVIQDNTSIISLIKSSTGKWIVSGTNTFTGATSVTGGDLTVTSASGLGAGVNVAVTNPTGGNVSVSANATLNYSAKTDGALAIGGSLTINGGTSTAIGGSIGATTTSARINVAGVASITDAAHAVNIHGVPGVLPTTGTYTLISGGAGSSLNPTTAPTLGKIYNNTGFTVGALSRTATTLSVDITEATPLATAYWTGNLAGSTNVWAVSNGSASNWKATADAASSQALIPGSTTDVVISATTPDLAPAATILGANMSIKSLTISDTTNGLGLNADGNTLTLASGGITMDSTVPASTIAAKVALGAPQTWTNNSLNDLTVSGAVSGANALTKAGSGTLVLSSANTFTGDTRVAAGTLALANVSAIATSTLDMNTADAGSASFTVAGTNTYNIGALSGSRTLNAGGNTLSIGAKNIATEFSGVLENATLTKVGTGNFTLSGDNTFTGNVIVSAGRLTLAHSNALGLADPNPPFNGRKGLIMQGVDRSLGLTGGITIPAFFDFFVSSVSNDGGGIENVSGNNEIQAQVNFSVGNAALNIASSAGTLTISGNITMTQTARTLYLAGVSVNDNTISGDITESSAAIMPVIKRGAGKWILSGTNTYKGDTTVNGGTLELANGGSQKFYPKSDASSNKITGNATGLLTLDGALNIDLTNANTATDWLLVDVDNVEETYGANFSVTGFTETAPASGIWKKGVGLDIYTFTESNGMLNLAVGGNTYANWLLANPPATGFDTDSDNDGVPNGLENVLGTNPNVYSAGLTNVSSTASSATYQHKLNPIIAGDVTYSYEWSTDLVEWKASTETNTGLTTATITPSAPAAGVVTVTTAITSGPAAKLFTRIKATQP